MVQMLNLSVIDKIDKLSVFSEHQELKEVTLSNKAFFNTKSDKTGDFLWKEKIFVEDDSGEIVFKLVL